jgi:hypothetical protein
LANCISNGLILSTSLADEPDPFEKEDSRRFLLSRICHSFLRSGPYDNFVRHFPSSPGNLTNLMDILVSGEPRKNIRGRGPGRLR